jgi:hypothetical protein
MPRQMKLVCGGNWGDLDPQDRKLTVATTRIHRLKAAGLTIDVIGADFLRRRIAPLQNKGRLAWEYRNTADIMRLRPGLNHNLTVMQHAALCQKLFHLKADKTDKADKTEKADKPLKLPAGVIPLCNNSALSSIIAMMPVFNAHGLDQTWAEPDMERVQEFFDNLSERVIREET